MTSEEIYNTNLIIAKFDGWEKDGLSPFAKENGRNDIFDWKKEVRPNTFSSHYGNNFNYNKDWNLLIPVVKKIINEEDNYPNLYKKLHLRYVCIKNLSAKEDIEVWFSCVGQFIYELNELCYGKI